MTSTPPKDPGRSDKHNDEAGGRIHQESFTHPEMELRAMVWPNEEQLFFSASHTELDIVEIYSNGQISQEKAIGPEKFASYCKALSLDPECMPALRLILIDNLVVPLTGESCKDQTTYLLHETFGVPMHFFRKLWPGQTWKNNYTSIVQRDQNGRPISIDGHYQFCRGLDSDFLYTRCFTWFSQSLAQNSATYIIFNCSESLKKLLGAVHSYTAALSRLSSPLAFHILLVDDAITNVRLLSGSYVEDVVKNANDFVFNRPASNPSNSARVINQALITICNLRNETAHIIAVLGFLEGVYKQYIDLVWSHDGKIDANRVCESLASLKNDANGLVIHLRRAEDKGAIKFNVDIALQNERNNKINTEIARLTAQIAVDSKRDSSSMITMAVLTMFFLPGTFISALFSMVFFNVSTDSTGKMTFTVSPFWWMYPVVTIPLTIVVFVVWIVWQKRRSLAIAHDLHSVLNPPIEDFNFETNQNELIRPDDEESEVEVTKSARSSIMNTSLRRVGKPGKEALNAIEYKRHW